MAVGASDLALLDLGLESRQRAAVQPETGDVSNLRPSDVIELQHDGVSLFAVDTRMSAEVVEDELGVPLLHEGIPVSGLLPLPLWVSGPAFVGSTAGTTPGIEAVMSDGPLAEL